MFKEQELTEDLISTKSTESGQRRRQFSLFGNFGRGNWGNDATLHAILYHLRRLLPDAEVTCICTGPETVAAAHNIAAEPIQGYVIKPWSVRSPAARLTRKLFVGIASELYRWLKCFVMMRRTDVLIIAGTGLLTDADGLMNNWGPYNVFKWSLLAKLSGCKLLFVSIGVGPLYYRLGRFLAKSALALADFRSYRDASSLQYLRSVGFLVTEDGVYPDLVFSLPDTVLPREPIKTKRRTIVGLGLMGPVGRLTVEKPNPTTYQNYLESLASFVGWLFAREYDVRLLIGDDGDRVSIEQFRCLLNRLPAYDSERIIDEPVDSVEHLLSQLAATDIVVATRFHNVLLALLLNKPVISISFHHKCSSLMSQMGLSEYCQPMKDLKAEKLIEQFCQLQQNTDCIKQRIREKVAACRDALDEQYGVIFKDVSRDRRQVSVPAQQIRHRSKGSVLS